MTADAARAELLTRVDIQTLVSAIKGEGPGVIRMRDGSTPSPAELDMIMQANKEDMRAANALMHQMAEYERDRADRLHRAFEIVARYSDDPDEVVGQILPRMTAADRAEFMQLSPALYEFTD